jgi:hypothetical protein
LSAFATVARDREALAIDIGDLQEEGFVEPEAQALDGGEVDLVVPGGSGHQEVLDLLHPEDGGEPVGGVGPQERERGPVAREHMLREEANPTGADTHGRRGKPSPFFRGRK